MATKQKQSQPSAPIRRRMTHEEVSRVITRLHRARDIVTELARYILTKENDPVVREDLYFKLIESLDFSPKWHNEASERTLQQLYEELTRGWWGDVEETKSKEDCIYETAISDVDIVDDSDGA